MTKTQIFVEDDKLCFIGEDGEKYCYRRSDIAEEFKISIKEVRNRRVGSTLEVDVEIESGYLKSATEIIRFSFNGRLVETRSITLRHGQTRELTFTKELVQGDSGSAQIRISGKHRYDSKIVDIAREVTGQIDIVRFETQLLYPIEGEPMSFFATIQNNTGTDIENAMLYMEVPEEVFTVELEVDMDEGEEKEFTFIWNTEVGDAGTYIGTLEAGEDYAETDQFEVLELSDEPLIVVNIVDDNSPVDPVESDRLEILVQATNVGPELAEAGIETVVKDEGITLSPILRVILDSTQRVTQDKTWGITSNDVGEHLILSESHMPP